MFILFKDCCKIILLIITKILKMTIWQSIITGIIEGLTEFLPISSTAHLIISGKLLNIDIASEFVKTYNISIQLGAIFAVIFIYWKKIINSKDLIFKISAAMLPTTIIGFSLYKIIKQYFMESLLIISISLFLGGIIIILFEKRYNKKEVSILTEEKGEDLSYKQAFLIGSFQTLAMIPGVSRSAATIITGLWLGLKRKTIVEFSFLLAIPTMAGATMLDLIKNKELILSLSKGDLISWAVGFSFSFVTALIGIKFLLRFIKKNNFIPFAWYRIALSIVIITYLFFN